MLQSISKSIQAIKGWQEATNENQLNIYEHLYALEKTRIWQKDSYYKGNPELSKLKETSFKDFIREVFGIGHLWFRRMQEIIAYKNGEGRKLFLKYGRSNMVTFLNSTPEERDKILEQAEKSVVTRKFCSIKSALFPKKRKGGPINPWRVKYIKLKKEFREYKAMVEKEFESMRHTIAILSRGHDPEVKKENET